jgi:hypothetical protein
MDAVVRIENFGLVTSRAGRLAVAGSLFLAWLEKRAFE